MTRVLLTLLIAIAGAACGPVGAQTVLPQGSEIRFVTRQMGVPVAGHFTRWQAQISLDPQAPQGGRVVFSIDTASAAFGAPETDAEVPKPAWFDSRRFPQASFTSSGLKPIGSTGYEVTGTLTLKGQARPLRVPVQLQRNGSGGVASGSFTLKRLDFGIGDGEWADTALVANEVDVHFKLQLAALPAP
jgi:polyisoprenoid-binding protein YceI